MEPEETVNSEDEQWRIAVTHDTLKPVGTRTDSWTGNGGSPLRALIDGLNEREINVLNVRSFSVEVV